MSTGFVNGAAGTSHVSPARLEQVSPAHLVRELAALRGELTSREEELSRLQRELAASEVSLARLERELAALRGELTAREGEIVAARLMAEEVLYIARLRPNTPVA
jgi:septal ring factor EnvC (AmiA/AmiB activator)